MRTEALCGLLAGSDSAIAEYLVERLLRESDMPPCVIKSVTGFVRDQARRGERLEEEVLELKNKLEVLEAGAKLLKEYRALEGER